MTKEQLPLDQHYKRSVIPLERADFDLWLKGTVEQASTLLRLATVEIFDAGPAIKTEPPVLQASLL